MFVWLFLKNKDLIILVVVAYYVLLNNSNIFLPNVVKPNFYFDGCHEYIYISVWYDEDSFTQRKHEVSKSNTHEVTLRAVLEMLFLY